MCQIIMYKVDAMVGFSTNDNGALLHNKSWCVAAGEVATMAFLHVQASWEGTSNFALDDDDEEAAEMALREEEFEL
jgi:hypothetical protein